MITTALRFQLPEALGVIELSTEVLAHFENHKQRKFLSREAGGQLFAVLENRSVIRVVEATGPRSTDRRSVFGYKPDRLSERAEIVSNYARGLHFIGDWHTHRQPIPKPSMTDERSMNDMVRKSTYDLPGFIMVIVGQASFPEGIYVSFHSKSISCPLALK